VPQYARHFVDKVLASSTDNLGDEFIEGYARFVDPTCLMSKVRSFAP